MSEIKPPHEQDPKRKWLLLGIPLCIVMGLLEFDRAIGGNNRSWLYVFEWPFFGAIAIYLWRRLLKGDMPKIPRPDLDALAREADEAETDKTEKEKK